MRRYRVSLLILIALASIAQLAFAGGDEIFSDGFESGDVSAWTTNVGFSPIVCPDSGFLIGVFEGGLGPAPPGGYQHVTCLTMVNDQDAPREVEIAFSSVPLPRALGLLDTDELAVIGDADRRIAAQFDVLSRWGGTVDDPTRPIRWLQVSVPVRVAADFSTSYALRRYSGLPAAIDPFEVTVDQVGSLVTVDTGIATAVFDTTNPAFLSSLSVDDDNDGNGRILVYSHSAGAGPSLSFDGGAGDIDLDTATPGQVLVDAGRFEIVEDGPVKTVLSFEGHFTAAGGESLCMVNTGNGPLSYERFGYTALFTLYRGSRDMGLQIQFRNECSSANGEPWTDEDVTVHDFTWRLPFTLGTSTSYFAGNGAITASALGFSGETAVEQLLGDDDGSGWTRRAQTRLDATVMESAATVDRPVVAVADSEFLVSAHMPWLRYREPQAMAVVDRAIELRMIDDSIDVGEGKGIWNFAKINIVQASRYGSNVLGFLEGLRARGLMELERGLLPSTDREKINSSLVYPSLGTDDSSTLKFHYLQWMQRMHNELLGPSGAWQQGKRYGSQLWPESGGNDPFGVAADTPDESPSAMNYWDPAGNELIEYLRSGDPRWVWDYALPAYWTQAFAAYLNIGRQTHGNRSGVAVTSGGQGCSFDEGFPCTANESGGGHWHRSAFGSDDYTYAQSLELAYTVRPSKALRDRFADAGKMIDMRYDIPRAQEGTRECFVNQVDITRQVIQHFEMLANCAEFVPGAQGQACHDKLQGVVDEMAIDNLTPGLMCQRFESDCFGNPPPAATQCGTPQQFMQNALMYAFFHRYWRNYGDPPSGSVRDMLVEAPRTLYQLGMPKLADGVNIDPTFSAGCDANDGSGCWWPRMDCTLSADQGQVISCVAAQDSDQNFFMAAHTRPHTVAQMLMAHEIEPSIALCEIAKTVFDVDTFTGQPSDGTANWNGIGHFLPIGWWKGTSQMMQGMAFAVGIYDTCTNPEAP